MKVILIVGACGSGKTWVIKQLIKDKQLTNLGKVGMVYYHRNYDIIALGKYDGGTFEGSDKLSMAVMRDWPAFMDAWKNKNVLVVAEGDRFMNSTFIESCRPIVIKIVDDGIKGRKKRKSQQTDRQIKSIATRVSKVTEKHLVLNSEIAYQTLLQYV